MRTVNITASETSTFTNFEVDQKLIDLFNTEDSEFNVLLDKTVFEIMRTINADQMKQIIKEMNELKKELAISNVVYNDSCFKYISDCVKFSINDYIDNVTV